MSSSIITQQSTGPATETQSGLVSTEAQTMVGTKTFADGIVLKPNTTPTTNPLSGLQVYAKSDNKLYTLNSSGIEQAVGSGGSIVLITQNAHGFTSADIGRPLYLNGSTYTFARANLEASAEVAGLINRIIDANTFEVCLSGEVTPVGANLIDGGGTLVAGEMYFLSTATAGKITTTEPSTVGSISKPIGIARTTTALDFYNMRGFAVGGSNVYTQIALGNNTTTTIQNVAAYDSLELQGWIFLNATTKYRFLFKAQVTKNGAATDYLVSFQHSGDTPPDGFNITVTTAGLVQVTLPSLSGFSSAIAQFSLNGPAIGVSLPLQIDSSNVSFGTIQAKNTNGIVFKEDTGNDTFTISDAGVARSLGGFDRFSAGINSGNNIMRTYRCEATIASAAGSTYDLLQNTNPYDDVILIYSLRSSSGYIAYKTGFCIFGGYGGFINSLDGSAGASYTLEQVAVTTGIGKLRLRVVSALPSTATFQINCLIIASTGVQALNGTLS